MHGNPHFFLKGTSGIEFVKVDKVIPQTVCSNEGLTVRNVSCIHQAPQAKNIHIPYQPLLIKPIFIIRLIRQRRENRFFSKLVFQWFNTEHTWMIRKQREHKKVHFRWSRCHPAAKHPVAIVYFSDSVGFPWPDIRYLLVSNTNECVVSANNKNDANWVEQVFFCLELWVFQLKLISSCFNLEVISYLRGISSGRKPENVLQNRVASLVMFFSVNE